MFKASGLWDSNVGTQDTFLMSLQPEAVATANILENVLCAGTILSALLIFFYWSPQQCYAVVTNYYSHFRGKDILTEGLSNLPKLNIQTGSQDCVKSWGIPP